MKSLIIGSTGMLGNTLKEYFTKINVPFETLDRIHLDFSLCSYNELSEKIKLSGCDVIINCAGLIKQRKNIGVSDFISVNSLLPHRLCKISNENNIKLIHITTDCVYNGKIGNYDEYSNFDIVDDYGISKMMGEPKDCTVIRTSIIGEETRNKLSLLEWVKSNEGNKIKGFTNHYWNGLTSLHLSKVIHQIIDQNLFWSGTRHIFSNKVNKYELVSIINEIYDLNIKIDQIETSEKIDRSLSSIYDTSSFNIPPLEQQIKETKLFHLDIR
jgi:dTDP-4-dehydrorhamnose reductase